MDGYATDRARAAPQPSADPGVDPDELEEWRWRNYTEHLIDLGYDLHGAGGMEPELPPRTTAGRR